MIKVVTWNMQGGGGADTAKNAIIQQFFNGGFDAICLQEMTNPLGSFEIRTMLPNDVLVAHMRPSTTSRDPARNYFCYYKRWGATPRCSLAIYTRGPAVACGVISLPAHLASTDQRPMLWVRMATHYYVASIHLSQAATGMMWDRFDYFRTQLAGVLPPGPRTLVIAGDYNRSPEVLSAGHPGVHFTSTPVNVSTHQSGGRLDYVYSDALVTELRYSLEFPSDHRYLTFTVH